MQIHPSKKLLQEEHKIVTLTLSRASARGAFSGCGKVFVSQQCSVSSEGCAAIVHQGCVLALGWRIGSHQFQEKQAEIRNLRESLMMHHFCYHGDVIVTAVCLVFFQYIIVNRRLYLDMNTFIFAKTSRDKACEMSRVQHN